VGALDLWRLDGLPGVFGLDSPVQSLFLTSSWASVSELPASHASAWRDAGDERAPPVLEGAPLPTSPPGAVLVGAAAAGGAAAAFTLLVCLTSFLWVAPPLRRWLRRQPGSRMLSVFVAPIEQPG
jgi:hypothetical protein